LPRRDLQLELLGIQPERERVDVLRTWLVDGGPPNAWRSSARSIAYGTRSDREVLILGGTRRVNLQVNGPHVPEFDQVRVLAGNETGFTVQVNLVRNGIRVVQTAPQIYSGDGALQTFTFDVPAAERNSESFAQIELAFAECTEGVSIAEVSTLDRSDLNWLPSIDAPALVTIGGEARPAVGLDAGTRLVVNFVPIAGEDLEFSFGRPNTVQRLDDHLRMRVSLWSRNVHRPPVITEWDLEPDKDETPWKMVRVEIDPRFANEPMKAVFEVLADDLKHGSIVLTPPALTRRTRDQVLILITADGLRLDDAVRGTEGENLVANSIAALQNSGLTIDAFSSTDSGVEAHRSILRGLPVGSEGFLDAPYLAQVLREHGFTTVAAVSHTALGPRSGLADGFDRYAFPEAGERSAAETLATMPKMLGELADRPLFIWFHVTDMMPPFRAGREFTRSYPRLKRSAIGRGLEPLPRHLKAFWLPEARDLDWIRDQYRAEITGFDHTLGKLLRTERLRDAHVVLTAPHGMGLGEAEFAWRHQDLFPSTLRVPFVVSGPEVGTTFRETPVGIEDAGRTLLARLELDHVPFPGRDALDAHAEAAAVETPEKVALEVDGHSASIVANGHMLVVYLVDHQGPGNAQRTRHGAALFDLTEDPATCTDVAAERPDIAAALRARLIDRLGVGENPAIDPNCECAACAPQR
tara:strand:+ start:435 stop:2519 length:2085 start_codon:yes stop_codon:yes gene_type:complete